MIQLSEQQYGDIADALGSARQVLALGLMELPELCAIERARFLLSLVDDRLRAGTIVREDVDG